MILSRFREHFGTAGLIVAAVALIVALTGGALAATGGDGSASKTKVKTGPRGPRGFKGAQGDQGAKGDTGPQGPQGPAGTNGTNGKDGQGATVSEIPVGDPECEERGGALVEAQAEVPVCNGEEGEQGIEGQPWTPNNTLPTGATETGLWSFNNSSGLAVEVVAPISFPIQLPGPAETEGLDEEHVHYKTDGDFSTFCEEKGAQELTVKVNGHLCVSQITVPAGSVFEGIWQPSFGGLGASKSGALVIFSSKAGYGFGLWAVKGP